MMKGTAKGYGAALPVLAALLAACALLTACENKLITNLMRHEDEAERREREKWLTGGPSAIPALTGTVNISGTAGVGQTLTADITLLGGSGAVSYQWKRDGADIPGETNASYTLQTADNGRYITVTVTRADNSGSVTAAAGQVSDNVMLATLSNQTVYDIHYVSPAEIYVLSFNKAALTYYLSKWNGNSLVTIDTAAAVTNANMQGLIAYKDANEYYAMYGSGQVYNWSVTMKKYVNGTVDSTITIPWQYGSMEGGFTGFEFFDNRLFFAGYSKSYETKIFTAGTSPLAFNTTPVYTRANTGAWNLIDLHKANGALYFVRGADNTPNVQVVLGKWNGTGFTELCAADTGIPGKYGIQPVSSVVRDDGTVFAATYADGTFTPHTVRVDKLSVASLSSWTTENLITGTPGSERWHIMAGDAQGYWRLRDNISSNTLDIMRFDYGTNTVSASYPGIPNISAYPGSAAVLEHYLSGDAAHLAYAVMSNATDTALRLVTLP